RQSEPRARPSQTQHWTTRRSFDSWVTVAASDGYRADVGASAQRALRLPGHCGWGHVDRVSERWITRKRTPGLSCDSTSLLSLQLLDTKSPTRVLELLLMP